MKHRTIQALLKYKVAILIFLIVGFLAGYFVTEYVVNYNFSYYSLEIQSNQHPDTFLTEEFFSRTLEEIDRYNEQNQPKISYADISYKKMLKKVKKENLNSYGQYRILVQRKYFLNTFRNASGSVNTGKNRCATYFKLILNYNENDTLHIEFLNGGEAEEVGYFNPYLLGGATAVGMLVISFAFFFIITKKDLKHILVDISDQERIFRTPFHKKYWIYAKNEFTTVRKICGMSVLFALMFICKGFTLPSGFGTLGIGLTYLFFSILSMIYGPIAGIVVGFLSDMLGYVVYQSGTVFFMGYTLNACLSGLVYGLCFYKTKITFAKCLYARLFVNLFVNVVLGSIWWAVIYDLNLEAMMTYMTIISLPKNLIYLLPQSILLYILLKAICKPLSHYGILAEEIGRNVSII